MLPEQWNAEVRCFVCGAVIKDAASTSTPYRPGLSTPWGLVFAAGGNYGSVYFDRDETDSELEIVVCNPCVFARRDRANVVRYERSEEVHESRGTVVRSRLVDVVPLAEKIPDRPCDHE